MKKLINIFYYILVIILVFTLSYSFLFYTQADTNILEKVRLIKNNQEEIIKIINADTNTGNWLQFDSDENDVWSYDRKNIEVNKFVNSYTMWVKAIPKTKNKDGIKLKVMINCLSLFAPIEIYEYWSVVPLAEYDLYFERKEFVAKNEDDVLQSTKIDSSKIGFSTLRNLLCGK